MAKVVNAAVAKLRELAAEHRIIASLYDRCAAQQELSDNLERYGTKLEDVRAELERLRGEIEKLETGMLERSAVAGRA